VRSESAHFLQIGRLARASGMAELGRFLPGETMIRKKVTRAFRAANRANSRKSTGPKTRRRQLVSLLNALGYASKDRFLDRAV
jgi:hypothetical protein